MATTTIQSQQQQSKPKKDLSIPKYHRRVMVFDTETSGLMPKHKAGTPFPPMEEYPYIMQFSWVVYNVASNIIEETVDEYVQIPDEAPISPESTKVNGITREITKEKGKQIAPLLVKFFAAYMKCDCIVAHNLRFDGEMVRKEMWRNRKELEKHVGRERANLMCGLFTLKFNSAYYIDTFCTMMNTIQFCGIDWVAKNPKVENTNKTRSPSAMDDGSRSFTEMNKPETLGEIVDFSLNPILEPILSEPKDTGVEPKDAAVEPKDTGVEPKDALSEPVSESEPKTPKSPTNNRKKFPRLNELYGKLFDTPLPMDMHNSIVDVLVCLRCFLKIRGAKEMSEDEFLELVKIHSRPA